MTRTAWMAAAAIAAGAGMPGAARAGDFMDTRITWTFGDDDFLADAGETLPDSPLMSIGDRDGYELFMDNIDSRYTGRENQTHLVMYKALDGFFDRLTTEAAVVIQFDLGEVEAAPEIADDGSYLRIRYGFEDAPETEEGDGVAVVFFPFDTERFRAGYLWDISWGGGGMFTNKRSGFAPGLRLELDIGPGEYFIGFKAAKVSELRPQERGAEGEPANVQETNYGGLAGGGWDLADWLRLDVSGGFFEQGTFDQPGLEGRRVYTFGGSARVVVHSGIDVRLSADYQLYRNVPWGYEALAEDAAEATARTEREAAGSEEFGWSVSFEGTILGQHLADTSELGVMGKSVIQPAYAAALQGRVQYGGFKAHLTGFVRNLEFILHNVPSFTPFVAIPSVEQVGTTQQFFAALGAETHFDGPHLTPSIIAGIQIPATLTTRDDVSGHSTTIVIRDEENRDILPLDEDWMPVFSARMSLRWDLSDILSLYAMLQYEHDENATRLSRDVDGTFRTYRRYDQIGASVIAQARF